MQIFTDGYHLRVWLQSRRARSTRRTGLPFYRAPCLVCENFLDVPSFLIVNSSSLSLSLPLFMHRLQCTFVYMIWFVYLLDSLLSKTPYLPHIESECSTFSGRKSQKKVAEIEVPACWTESFSPSFLSGAPFRSSLFWAFFFFHDPLLSKRGYIAAAA